MPQSPFRALVAYEDPYVQPLIVESLKSVVPSEQYSLIDSPPETTAQQPPLLQFRAYESLDFERALVNQYNLINAYVIRKALIRKHYLSQTVFSWVTKHPDSALRRHFKPAVDFELDYAEFLDDALVEAFELRAALEFNETKEPSEREWWILKPGMSDRGQGIRLFSTEDELRSIFEEWEEGQDDDSEEDDEDDEEEAANGVEKPKTGSNATEATNRDYIVTSHLRHFIAQPYIHPPLLFPLAPFNNRKFHIRTYVVAAGALRVYVYNRMLALFASEPYTPPWTLEKLADKGTSKGEDAIGTTRHEHILQRLRDTHLTNTCVQSSRERSGQYDGTGSTDDDTHIQIHPHVHLFSSLPLTASQHATIISQIHATTAELFRAALAHPTHFQPLPCAFEIFGVDFLLEDSAEGADAGTGSTDDNDGSSSNAEQTSGLNVQLLEVNAFPDFAQTGDKLRELVVAGLFDDVVAHVVAPFFGVEPLVRPVVNDGGEERLTKVLDVDLRRR